MVNESPSNNEQICPKCKSPIEQGLNFCETCGAKIDQMPAPLVIPDEPVAPLVKPAQSSAAEDPKKPENPPEPVSPIKDKHVDKKPSESKKDAAPQIKKSSLADMPKNQMMIIGGIVGVIIIAIIVFLLVIPMISGTGSAAGQGTGGSLPASSSQTHGSATGSFVTDPTQVPPTNLLVTYQADRDPITGIVTVTFTGGPGKSGVRDVFIQLTTADGYLLNRTFNPAQIGSTVTLQGTKKTDRIEVTANYYNGDQYKIIDKILEPRSSS